MHRRNDYSLERPFIHLFKGRRADSIPESKHKMNIGPAYRATQLN